ncbi:hypothetical protein OG905_08775 [Streptomyces sp. NBC_00322]|uniref:hypothetical protein n=1 Tax=Streptomyces sp. NBC_00322 TaxID=2975712 RepID=UPI002E2E2EA0|nr:hypothetical protein [Streptomyces sp. NBC_00322]
MLDTDRPESRLRAHADRYARWAGLAVGVVAAPLWATVDITNYPLYDIGVPWVSYVTAFGLCAVGGVLLGDALTPRPREAVRTASLTPRRVRDHVPPRITRLLLLQAVFLVVLVGIGDATATQGGMERAIGAMAGDGGCDGTEPPVILWPGIFHSRQILGSLAIGTVACAWALRRVARRAGDDQQRRDRSWAIVAAWGVLVSALLLLVVLMIATWLTDNCASTMGSVTSLAIYPLGLLPLFTLAWSLFTVAVPRAARR